MKILKWILAGLTALILLQTLYFKFTAAPESVYIFSSLGLEPWGRIGSGIAELMASILLLIPSTRHFGALLSVGVISGALLFHLTKLGIEVQGDGGFLFILAVIVFLCSAFLLYFEREKLLKYVKKS